MDAVAGADAMAVATALKLETKSNAKLDRLREGDLSFRISVQGTH